MKSKITKIEVQYEDGSKEELSRELVNKINSESKSYISIDEFFKTILNDREKDQQLKILREELETNHETEIEQIIQEKDIYHEKGIKQQAAKIGGDVLQRFCPFSENYPYNPRDIHPIFALNDYLVYKGESKNFVEKVIFQEMKSGYGAWAS